MKIRSYGSILGRLSCFAAVIGYFHAMTKLFQHSDSHFPIDGVILRRAESSLDLSLVKVVVTQRDHI